MGLLALGFFPGGKLPWAEMSLSGMTSGWPAATCIQNHPPPSTANAAMSRATRSPTRHLSAGPVLPVPAGDSSAASGTASSPER
ncbi:hypothetical protein AHiyo4_25260 [Arthrobacter sp. Hiyo4]|nr:hypothetical protein AHiyo4_25260 [Arthrobacter sp. Hiyo4]